MKNKGGRRTCERTTKERTRLSHTSIRLNKGSSSLSNFYLKKKKKILTFQFYDPDKICNI